MVPPWPAVLTSYCDVLFQFIHGWLILSSFMLLFMFTYIYME